MRAEGIVPHIHFPVAYVASQFISLGVSCLPIVLHVLMLPLLCMCSAAALYSVGTAVEVRLDNGEWAPATIIGIKPPVAGNSSR
jgi:hypothetical protein